MSRLWTSQLCLSTVLTLAAFAIPLAHAGSTSADVNGDSVLDAVDVQATINTALGLAGFDADVDDSGVVDAVDIQKVINAVLGIVESLSAIMFVTQTPFSGDFATIMSTFGTHKGTAGSAPRGGDLYIRYADGSVRNLTAELGFGTQPQQEIAVRDPYPHWTGTKALFSMVIGGTTQNNYDPVYFQISVLSQR